MLAILVFATIVASVVAPPPKGQKVHFQPLPKAVPLEEAVFHGDKVPLLKQSPEFRKEIVTVVDEVPVIIKKPKHIIKENPVRVHYPVDKPFIQHKRILKPIHKTRTIVIKKKVNVPRPIIRTKTIGVPKPYVVPKPFKRVKTVTQVFERVHKIPKPIPRPQLKVVHRDRPFPVENLVIRKKPRVIEVPYDQKVPIVETITHIKRQPVAQPRDKVLTVDHPVVNRQKVPYFPKGAQGGGPGNSVSYEESQARSKGGFGIGGGAIDYKGGSSSGYSNNIQVDNKGGSRSGKYIQDGGYGGDAGYGGFDYGSSSFGGGYDNYGDNKGYGGYGANDIVYSQGYGGGGGGYGYGGGDGGYGYGGRDGGYGFGGSVDFGKQGSRSDSVSVGNAKKPFGKEIPYKSGGGDGGYGQDMGYGQGGVIADGGFGYGVQDQLIGNQGYGIIEGQGYGQGQGYGNVDVINHGGAGYGDSYGNIQVVNQGNFGGNYGYNQGFQQGYGQQNGIYW